MLLWQPRWSWLRQRIVRHCPSSCLPKWEHLLCFYSTVWQNFPAWSVFPHIFQSFQRNVPGLLDMKGDPSKIWGTWLSFALHCWEPCAFVNQNPWIVLVPGLDMDLGDSGVRPPWLWNGVPDCTPWRHLLGFLPAEPTGFAVTSSHQSPLKKGIKPYCCWAASISEVNLKEELLVRVGQEVSTLLSWLSSFLNIWDLPTELS